jgi:hypothetical protein
MKYSRETGDNQFGIGFLDRERSANEPCVATIAMIATNRVPLGQPFKNKFRAFIGQGILVAA